VYAFNHPVPSVRIGIDEAGQDRMIREVKSFHRMNALRNFGDGPNDNNPVGFDRHGTWTEDAVLSVHSEHVAAPNKQVDLHWLRIGHHDLRMLSMS
jgi:hypothetical protein